VDYAVRPAGVVITRPRLAAREVVYDVRDAVEQAPLLLPNLKTMFGDSFPDVPAGDGPAVLVRVLANAVELRPWETVQVLNRTRLVVYAAPRRHEEIADLLEAVRRLAGVAVVMNARLYEVDRAFFAKEVAPLLAGDKDAEERPAVVRVGGPLLKKITRQKLLLEGEDVKIRPGQETPFLARQSVFRFAAGPVSDREDRPGLKEKDRVMTGTGLAGVSFEVRPLVSSDRRYLRLHVSQSVVQLVGIDKTKRLDPATGKEVEVESPNLRKASVAGTVQVPDGAPFLMPVDYRPPGKENEDKVWLLAARPIIWIREEVEEIRKQRGEFNPKSVWDSEPPEEEEKPAPAKRLPLSDEVKEILQAVIADVLTNPDLKKTREFYGTEKDRTLTLVDTAELGWPKAFCPETHGYKLVQPQRDPFVNGRRVLGIRLDKFDLKQKKADLSNAPLEICIINAGGSANGAVIGGCLVYYAPKREGDRWTVECVGAIDP
jgi:hypothetical protein